MIPHNLPSFLVNTFNFIPSRLFALAYCMISLTKQNSPVPSTSLKIFLSYPLSFPHTSSSFKQIVTRHDPLPQLLPPLRDPLFHLLSNISPFSRRFEEIRCHNVPSEIYTRLHSQRVSLYWGIWMSGSKSIRGGGKNEKLQELQSQIKHLGLIIKDVLNDGNSLYRSFADKILGNEAESLTL